MTGYLRYDTARLYNYSNTVLFEGNNKRQHKLLWNEHKYIESYRDGYGQLASMVCNTIIFCRPFCTEKELEINLSTSMSMTNVDV